MDGVCEGFCDGGIDLCDRSDIDRPDQDHPGEDTRIIRDAGVVLGALGIYEPIVDFGGAGATVPLPGFGYALAKGVQKGVEEYGLLGIFTGGVSATAGGITAAIVFGYLAAVFFSPKSKK